MLYKLTVLLLTLSNGQARVHSLFYFLHFKYKKRKKKRGQIHYFATCDK